MRKAAREFRDWAEGDLLRVTHPHGIVDANKEGIWPDIINKKSCIEKVIGEEIVLAVDPKPNVGKPAIIRVIHDGNIWVVNSNFVERVWPENTQAV